MRWQWHQLAMCKSFAPRTTPVPHHSAFLQAGCPSSSPAISIKALKEKQHVTKQTQNKWRCLMPKRWVKLFVGTDYWAFCGIRCCDACVLCKRHVKSELCCLFVLYRGGKMCAAKRNITERYSICARSQWSILCPGWVFDVRKWMTSCSYLPVVCSHQQLPPLFCVCCIFASAGGYEISSVFVLSICSFTYICVLAELLKKLWIYCRHVLRSALRYREQFTVCP